MKRLFAGHFLYGFFQPTRVKRFPALPPIIILKGENVCLQHELEAVAEFPPVQRPSSRILPGPVFQVLPSREARRDRPGNLA